MNFDQIQQQANGISQHNTNIVQQLQQAATRIQSLPIDDAEKQSLMFSLREIALSVKGLNQETMGLIQNAALYIQHLEASHPQYDQYRQMYPPQYQQAPINPGFFGGGGGFWGTIIQSAEMGAGFEIGRDLVDDIFGWF